MATFYHHHCDSCGYSFTTSGPHEFYRDFDGRLADYGHPLPSSLDAELAGVYGFYGNMWCLQCHTNIEVVMREFVKPVDRHQDIWTPGAHPERPVRIVCPICGDDSPVLGDRPFGTRIPCPKCGGVITCRPTEWS
jgi:transcription elongation factor Elf1